MEIKDLKIHMNNTKLWYDEGVNNLSNMRCPECGKQVYYSFAGMEHPEAVLREVTVGRPADDKVFCECGWSEYITDTSPSDLIE